MKTEEEIKLALYRKCNEYIDQRIESIQKKLDELAESRNNETKSTAGDKHETGRSMMQLEEQKTTVQLYAALDVKQTTNQIDINKRSKEAILGSLVICNTAKYFISISAGKIPIDGSSYYAISLQSPIGRQLSGKTAGETIEFNDKKITILKIY